MPTPTSSDALNERTSAPTHNTSLPLKRPPPASFRRLLGSPRQRHSQTRLLHRDQIKLAERLLIKQRPFLAISAAPVFMTTRNSDEIARADAFGTGIIPVQIGAT